MASSGESFAMQRYKHSEWREPPRYRPAAALDFLATVAIEAIFPILAAVFGVIIGVLLLSLSGTNERRR